MIDSLKLGDESAAAIVALGIEFGVYTDDMPESRKERLEAAHEMISYAVEAYGDGLRSDSKDKDNAEAGEQVEAILKAAGVKANNGDIEYGKPLTGNRLSKLLDTFDLELDSGSENGDAGAEDDGDDDEAAFEIDDMIDGYDELSPASKIKAIKKLKLDPEDDDDAAKLNAIADYEDEQDKPSSRVMDYIEELLGEEEAGDDDDADDSDDDDAAKGKTYTEKELMKLDKDELREVAEEFGVEFPKRLTDAGRQRTAKAIVDAQDGGGSDDEAEEPWDGYDETSVKDIKAALTEAAEDEDEPLSVEQVENVIEYEQEHENRKLLVRWLNNLLDEVSDSDGDKDEEEERPKLSRRRRGASDPDDSADVDDAVDQDDEKEARSSRRKAKSNGKLVLTRDDIILALTEGQVSIG